MATSDWDATDPVAHTLIASIPGKITDAKGQVALRNDKEHTAFDSGGLGGEHKEGSAKAYLNAEASAPTTRPDGSTALDDGGEDDGRLWVQEDTRILKYWDDEWLFVSLAGLLTTDAQDDGSTQADHVALLPGRTSGQTLSGGTATTEGLTLQANTAEDSTGTILIEGDGTAEIDFDSVPVSNLVLGGDADGQSTDGTDGYKISGIDDADTAHDVLTYQPAVPVISLTEVADDGSIALACNGTSLGTGANQTADVGFAPDLVIAWNEVDDDNARIWSSDHPSNTKSFGGTYETAKITVSGTVITFPDGGEGYPNRETKNFFYIAIKTNKSVNPTVPA